MRNSNLNHLNLETTLWSTVNLPVEYIECSYLLKQIGQERKRKMKKEKQLLLDQRKEELDIQFIIIRRSNIIN